MKSPADIGGMPSGRTFIYDFLKWITVEK